MVRPWCFLGSYCFLTDTIYLGAYTPGFDFKVINLGISLKRGTIKLKSTEKAAEVIKYLRTQAAEESLEATFSFIDKVPAK